MVDNNTRTIYTGTLLFKDIEFTFVFDTKKLHLIPPEGKKQIIEWEWKMRKIQQGLYTIADPIPVEELYIIGNCNETNSKIVFIPTRGSYLEFTNSVVCISLEAFIIYKYNKGKIDRISFTCQEINYIHQVNQAVSLLISPDEFANKGIATINTREFDATTTEKQNFYVDGNEVSVHFGISRKITEKIEEPPLQVNSSMMFEFEASDDYSFIFRLWHIAKDFIRFLCYRKNIYIPEAELYTANEDGKQEDFATMYVLGQDGETEKDTLIKGRYIKQAYIAGHEGQILTDIANDDLYLRHLPGTYHSGRHIDAARFIMITAAFEWEFRRLYPNGVEKSDATRNAEKAVTDTIQNHIDNTSGKQKNIYKFLKKLVASDNMQAEVIQMGKDFSDIIGMFGDRLYQINKQELKYTEMGQRISDQRNHFAHGDLDKEFIGTSLLDLIYLEYVIYAMQLKYYGLDDKQIQKAVNELFHLNFAI